MWIRRDGPRDDDHGRENDEAMRRATTILLKGDAVAETTANE